MEMLLVSPCTSGIIPHTSTEMEENECYSPDQARRSFSERRPETPSLFGENLLTTASTSAQESAKPELTAQLSETRAHSDHLTSYAKHAKSLLIAGLIAGITPTWTRRNCGADCREAALLPPDGNTSASEDIDLEPSGAEN